MTRAVRRIAFFEPYPHLYGGGQRTTHLLAGALRARGLEVTVVVPAGGAMVERLQADGLDCSIVTLPAALATYGHRTPRAAAAAALPVAWARLGRTWRDLRPDVVHATNLRGMLLAGPPARALRHPTVWHVHLGEPQPRLNRAATALASAVVVPSPGALPDLPGVPAGSVTVIPNAVPPEALSAACGPATRRGPSIVSSARLTPQKGLDVLIEAIPSILSRHPGLQVTVFGAPQAGYEDHAAALGRSVARRGLSGVVTFAGTVTDPFRRYQDAAVYVQPSRHEILPLAILEAMAAGLPVVATDVGGVSGAVVHGHTGLLVPPEDAAALATAIGDLLADPDRASALGAAGARRAHCEFGLDAMTDRWLDLYRSLV